MSICAFCNLPDRSTLTACQRVYASSTQMPLSRVPLPDQPISGHISADTAADAAKVNELLVTAGCEVFHLASAPVSLEDIFLKLTREQVNGREA